MLTEQQYHSEIKKTVGALTSLHRIFFFFKGIGKKKKKHVKTVIFSPHQHPNAHMQILC